VPKVYNAASLVARIPRGDLYADSRYNFRSSSETNTSVASAVKSRVWSGPGKVLALTSSTYWRAAADIWSATFS